MAYTLDDYIKQAKKASAADQKKAIADSDKLYTAQADATKELYKGQITETEKSYEDNYRENAIQKLINEREVAENMANMGITDSGLNRTQQTAVQLSYANQKANIDKTKQQQVDAFLREMNSQLATIEQNRLASAASIKDSYNKAAIESGTTAYGDYQDQVAASKKEYYDYLEKKEANEKKNSYIIKANDALLSRDYTGTLKDNGVTSYKIEKDDGTYVRYVDSKSGKKVDLPLGMNPYTGKFADDVLDANGYYDASKAFKGNGYQPNNYNGKPLTESGITDIVNGNRQNVWKTADGKLYIWIGADNKYIPYVE